jgi:2-oxoglutarate/2-oxoacid ferredoxin oxidoreductase subunit alpha
VSVQQRVYDRCKDIEGESFKIVSKAVQDRERVVVRFAGDSGDGMQLVGGRFTDATAVLGNDLATLPDFPAEIRAPAGTIPGVSAFQIHFASRDILTPGDTPNVLVAMNPAALKANLATLERGTTIIVNEDAFTQRNLDKAGYPANPLEDDTLAEFRVHRVPMTTLTARAAEGLEGVSTRDASRAKNLFALGLLSWLYGRPTDVSERWIEAKFATKPAARAANLAAFRAGWSFGETTELLDVQYRVAPATDVAPGTYRQVNGTTATALGLIAASVRSGLPLLLASYPITPASELLHELSRHAALGVRTIQAEDEIAAAGMALGAAFGGHLGVTATSGPGMDLKAETIGLAAMLELPLVVVDVQRAGPSTGLPTKTEQSDLLMALHGRHGESPLPVLAAATPGDCFEVAYEAARIAVAYRTPVILLSDGFLSNSSEPWRIPGVDELPDIDPAFAEGRAGSDSGEPFLPYARDGRGVRPWARPGTPGLAHRVGGLEKQDGSGNISYDPANHATMTRLRAERIAGIARELAPLDVDADAGAELLVLGWGSSYGSIRAAVRRVRDRGIPVARAHLRHLNPLAPDLGELLRAYPRVLVPEMNTGQLARVLRAEFLVDVRSHCKVSGQPLFAAELETAIVEEAGRSHAAHGRPEADSPHQNARLDAPRR